MSRAMDTLMQAQHKAAETLYKQQQEGAQGAQSAQGAQGASGAQGAGAQGAEGAQGAKAEGDVIDAEVVEDDKK
jgi:hypothetical protein